MTIDNIYIPYELNEILLELRSQLNANNIRLLSRMTDSGDDIMVQCPYHKEGQERRPSAGIRKSDGMFHCLACGETHSLPEVISYCFGHYNDMLFGHKWLIKNFVSVSSYDSRRNELELDLIRSPIERVAEKINKYIEEQELDKYRYVHPYMYERGLTDEIIEQFDIGYDRSTDSITFPVRDMNGDCMFVARRSVSTKRFDIPKGITKPLYGMYELCSNNTYLDDVPDKSHSYVYRIPGLIEKIYVCEGLFDCLRLWCVGKFAVAGFGCLFNSYQIKQLQDLPTRTIVLALDNDEAGRKATERLKKLVTNKLIYTVELPEGRKDVGECTDDEIQDLTENLY